MLSQATTSPPPAAVMWTAAQLRERDGVSKQAITRKVRALAEHHGLQVQRGPRGQIVRFNVAQYDHLRGRYADPSKDQRPADAGQKLLPASESYDEAVRQRAWTEAEKSRLLLEETKGNLIRVEPLQEAIRLSGSEIAQVINRLVNSSDDMAAAVAREGSHGLRALLKKISHAQCEEIAKILSGMATAAPEHEPDTQEEAAAAASA